MPNYPSVEDLLGASDLEEQDVELESLGMTVRIRALAGAYSNRALSDAYEVTTVQGRGGRQEQTTHLDTQRLEELQVQYGLIAPKLATIEEVRTFAQRTGKAWQTLVKAIQDISGLSTEEVVKADSLFRAGRSEPGPDGPRVLGNGAGDHQPDIPSPASP